MKKDNMNRFMQDMDCLHTSDVKEYDLITPTESKEFLENGTIVNLTAHNIRHVEIIERICIVGGKYYDYKGEYTDQDGKKAIIYFMVEDIE